MGGPAAQAINSQAQRPIRAHRLAAHSILEVRSSLAQRPLRPTESDLPYQSSAPRRKLR